MEKKNSKLLRCDFCKDYYHEYDLAETKIHLVKQEKLKACIDCLETLGEEGALKDEKINRKFKL